MGALRPFRFFISFVPSYFVIMDVRVCRCRRKSRRYAALPFGGFDPPPSGPRPLCGHCPGLILRLAATRLPGALHLCSMPGRAYGATVTSAALHAFIFHRKWVLCAHSVFFISSVPSYFVIMDVRVRRCRRKSRSYAALPFGGLRKPRTTSAGAFVVRG